MTKSVLVSGASFAGLSTAFWLSEMGYRVVIVEDAPSLRTGGTAVDIKGETVGVVKRMGLFEAIRANRLGLERWEIKDADDRTVRALEIRERGAPPPEDEFEIERNVLLHLLYEKVASRCDVVFGDRIAELVERDDAIDVTFRSGTRRPFELVFGCDGMHSGVRKLWFGEEARFTHFLQQYFSITIVDELLIERNTAQMFNVPGKAIMLNAYKDKTDIIFGFVSETELAYDRRDEEEQRRIVRDRFARVGWRAPELLQKIEGSSSFYFDKLAQVRMPAWSRGRVALVGDAAYCPSPAAGMGGSLAIDGAAALADAMRLHDRDHDAAFRAYDEKLRPFIDQVQAEAVRVGLETLVPRTEEAIHARNAMTANGF